MRTNQFHKNLAFITDSALLVREWERKHLPIEQSFLALDLFLTISHHTLIDKPLTLKLLCNSVYFSETGIRKHLRRFITDEWCVVIGTERDRRLRHIVALPKMLNTLNAYSQVLAISYSRIKQ